MTTSAIEVVDGRSVSFSEGSVEATKVYILNGFTSEQDVIVNGFNSTQPGIGGAASIRIPKVGSPHPLFPALLFAYAYELNNLPGEHDKWRATFRYRRTAATPQTDINDVGAGPAFVGFEELSARVTGSFNEGYRASPNVLASDTEDGDIGGEPVDRAGVPTSILRTQMEVSLSRTMSEFDPGDFLKFVGTLNNVTLFGMQPGTVVYRGANISRIETNKFTVQHTWLYDQDFHLIQDPQYTLAGTPKLGKEGLYTGKAYPVIFVNPFTFGNSHTLAPDHVG